MAFAFFDGFVAEVFGWKQLFFFQLFIHPFPRLYLNPQAVAKGEGGFLDLRAKKHLLLSCF